MEKKLLLSLGFGHQTPKPFPWSQQLEQAVASRVSGDPGGSGLAPPGVDVSEMEGGVQCSILNPRPCYDDRAS